MLVLHIPYTEGDVDDAQIIAADVLEGESIGHKPPIRVLSAAWAMSPIEYAKIHYPWYDDPNWMHT